MSELRKKHGLEISRIKELNEAARSQVTRNEVITLVSSSPSAKGMSPLNKAKKIMEEQRNGQKKAAESRESEQLQSKPHELTPRKVPQAKGKNSVAVDPQSGAQSSAKGSMVVAIDNAPPSSAIS